MVNWLSVIIGIVPALIWFFFFLQEDSRRPEPKGLIVSTFILGGLATFIVLQLQFLFRHFAESLGIKEYSPFSIFWLAGIEEVMKFLVVLFWISRRQEFDEPVDAMIYMIITALGFATVENIASTSRSLNGFELVTLRFIGANLLHSLSSGLVGFYWGDALLQKKSVGQSIIIGLFLATLLHGVFNGLVLAFGPALYVTIFLVFVGFFILNDFEKLKRPVAV